MSRLLPALVVLSLAAACGRSGSAETPVKSQLLTAAEGGTVSVSAAENVTLAGTTLEVPPGALEKDTRLTVGLGTQDLVAAAEVAGPVAVWGPPGTRFSPKATLTLPLAGDVSNSTISIVVREASGAESEIASNDVTVAGGRVSFLVGGFTSFQPKKRPGAACPADARLCPDGSSVSRTGPNCTFPECPESDGGVVACMKDARVCPDGTTVGRVPPACDFAPCPESDAGVVACTKDARVCPDGTTVGRVPPACDFAPCPVPDGGTVACTRDAKVCADGTTVGRVPPACDFAPCPCHRGGCSNHVCADEPGVVTTCEWRDEYACYQQATCARQPNGQCGFTPSQALTDCLADAGVR